MVDVAVIIVTWNVRHLIGEALRSLYADLAVSGLTHRVLVVDSASSDGTAAFIAEAFPQVELYASKTNLGFSGGNNHALRSLGFGDDEAYAVDLPRTVYLLNPDTITKLGATRALFDALMGADAVGLVGAQLEYEDGSFQHGAFAFPGLRQLWIELFPTPARLYESRFNGRYPRLYYAAGHPFDVDFTLGATMMLKREVVQQTGMFDGETFFMYCEEVDWAWRIHRAGWRVQTVPEARVVHLAGKSTSQIRPQSTLYLWTSRLKLYDRYYPFWKRWLARQMVFWGMGRKIWQAKRDTTLISDERAALIDAYQQIQALARASSPES